MRSPIMVYCSSPTTNYHRNLACLILHSLLSELKDEFPQSRKGEERGAWFIHTLVAIILPFTSSRTSNLLRTPATLFRFTDISWKRYLQIPFDPGHGFRSIPATHSI